MSYKAKMNLLITLLVIVAEVVSGYTRYSMDTTTHDIVHNYGMRDFTLKSHSGISPQAQPITPSPEDYEEYGAVAQWGGRVPRHQPSIPIPRNNLARFSYSDHSNYVNANFLDDGYQSDQAPVGEVTADKINRLGTPEAVQESKRTYIKQTASLTELALKHRAEMREEGRCRIPRKELVYMNEETNVQYIPRATFLHRCSMFSGCCESGYLCQAKNNTVEIVEKAFYVAVNNKQAIPRMIQLQNHTECECVRNEMRRKRSTNCQCPKHFTDFSLSESQWGDRINTVQAQGQRCRCDCHLNNETCKRLKNGGEGFSVMERRRILRGESSPPFCSYGAYDMKNGRCPRPGYQNTNPSLQYHKFQSNGHNGKS